MWLANPIMSLEVVVTIITSQKWHSQKGYSRDILISGMSLIERWCFNILYSMASPFPVMFNFAYFPPPFQGSGYPPIYYMLGGVGRWIREQLLQGKG